MSELGNDFQIGAWAVAIIGGLITAWKAIAQRQEDMRWKRAEMAKKCLDEIFGNHLAQAAMKMLDWDNLTYDIPGYGERGPITTQARHVALRTKGTVFYPKGDEQFIRDAFDALFDGLEMLEHFLEIKLIEFADVKQPLSYYVGKLSKAEEYAAIQPFLTNYEFSKAEAFLRRYPKWRSNQPIS
jgi:hypothetical protein